MEKDILYIRIDKSGRMVFIENNTSTGEIKRLHVQGRWDKGE